MKQKLFILLGFICVGMILFSSTLAMGQNPPNYVVVKGGVFIPGGDLEDDDYDTGLNGEVAYGRYFHPNFALEGGLGYHETETSEDNLDVNLSIIPVTVTAKGVYNTNRIEVFGGAGVGVYAAVVDLDRKDVTTGIKASDDDADAVFGLHVLAGANFNVSGKIFIGVEGRYTWTGDAEFHLFGDGYESNLNGYSVTGNVGFRF